MGTGDDIDQDHLIERPSDDVLDTLDPETGELTPRPARSPFSGAQQDVLDQLGARGVERPDFDAGLRVELRALLEHELEPLVERLDEPLFVSKHKLSQVHGCEAKFLAEHDEDFVVSVPVARGTIAHKAIELSVHWRGEPVALEMVDEAIARLTVSDNWLADFLERCSEAELAELRSESGERVAKFLECWPPLKRSWAPVTESKLRVELFDSQIVFQGKVDLTLGRAHGTTAGKVIVDFKTGGSSPAHLDDLRFYALLETIRLGTPPRRLASYYLDQGRFQSEDVSIPLLEAAAIRATDGARKMVELLTESVEATRKPSIGCRWCPLLDDCEPGRASLDPDDL